MVNLSVNSEMRKNLKVKLSWYSPENLKILVDDGYLPIFAIASPEVYKGTPIHLPVIAPRVKDLSVQEYKSYLENRVIAWKVINSMDVLSHVSCAPKGVVILTDLEKDPYREVLGKFLGGYLSEEVTEYEYDRNQC